MNHGLETTVYRPLEQICSGVLEHYSGYFQGGPKKYQLNGLVSHIEFLGASTHDKAIQPGHGSSQ